MSGLWEHSGLISLRYSYLGKNIRHHPETEVIFSPWPRVSLEVTYLKVEARHPAAMKRLGEASLCCKVSYRSAERRRSLPFCGSQPD